MEQKKINRENLARHLIEKELEMVGKTMLDTLDNLEWYSDFTMNSKQHEEFKKYSLGMIKKILKVNTIKANSIFDWFDMCFGLRIKN